MAQPTMYATVIKKDDENTLEWKKNVYEVPTPGPKEVLVQVHATALNRADLLQRKGMYPPPPGASEILGLEMAGEIVACGTDVTQWQIGDRVCSLLEGGGYAQFVACHEGMLLPVPAQLSFEQAAALPEVFYTAYLNIYMEAAAQPGERVLLHAGASGVGTAGIQLCQAFGNPVYATTSTPKVERVKELGATLVVDRLAGSWLETMRGCMDDPTFDVILDPVGANYLQDNIRALRRRGRLVLIGLMGGPKAELPLHKVLVNRLRVLGSVLRSRSREEKLVITEALKEKVWPLFATDQLHPIIDRVFPITEANEAHEVLAGNQTFGKVILQVSHDG